jgi:hypothetical protein
MCAERAVSTQRWDWVVPKGNLPGSLTVTSRPDGGYDVVLVQKNRDGLTKRTQTSHATEDELEWRYEVIGLLLEGLDVTPPWKQADTEGEPQAIEAAEGPSAAD